ncbi:hypothetical protein Tco_1390223, partial [Tanacetum coccineum]
NEKEQMIVEAKKKGRKSKGKKEAKKMKKAEEQNQVELGEEDVLYEGRIFIMKEEENKESKEEEVRKLIKIKMEKGVEEEYNESDYEEEPKQKCLKEMGFERMIHFPILELPSALAFHVIEHFHPASTELRLERESIKITRQKVNYMLRIPMGSRKLEDLEEKPSNDPFIKQWEEHFRHLQKPTPPAIASVISDTEEVDFMFKMNFVTLFGSTMGTLENGGRVSTKLLKRISEDVDISDI